MERLSGQDLKTKGVTGIAAALKQHEECLITVHGRPRYVVMPIAHLEYYRERDLELASLEVKKDIDQGNYTTDLQAHLKEITDGI